MADDNFISYSRKDFAVCLLLKERLEAKGLTTWFDIEDIPIGESWRIKAEKGIKECQNFICLCSENFISSNNCLWELKLALENHRRIIPVCLVGFKDFHILKMPLRELNFLVLDLRNLSKGISELESAINSPWGLQVGEAESYYLESPDGVTPLYRSRYLLGRAPKATDWELTGIIVVTGGKISRTHAVLERLDADWFIKDVSRNGLLRNQMKLDQERQYKLSAGDKLHLSDDTSVLFRKIRRSNPITESEFNKATCW